MFDYIGSDQLRELLIKIQRNDESVLNTTYGMKLCKYINDLDEENIENLAYDIIKNKKILNYIFNYVRNTSLNSIENNDKIYKFMRELYSKKLSNLENNNDEYDDEIFQIYEICIKLDFTRSLGEVVFGKFNNNEVFFQIIFDVIKNDSSLTYLKAFINILDKAKYSINDGILFDFIELVSNLKFNFENYQLIHKLILIFDNKDDMKKEIEKIGYKNFKLSNEFKFVDRITDENIDININKFDMNLLALSLDEKNIRYIIKVLEILKNEKKYEKLIDTLIHSQFISINHKKMIQIIEAKKLHCNEEQIEFIKEYINKNNINMDDFKREYCMEDYIEDIKKEIETYLNTDDIENIKFILEREKELDIIKEISEKILRFCTENNKLDSIIELWDDLRVSVSLQKEYGNKIKESILLNQDINEEQIQFLIDLDLDNTDVYKSLSNEKTKSILLRMWNKNNKIGKIVDAIKYKIDREIKEINDFEDVKEIINEYEINDYRLESIIKLKVYSYIELELLDIDYLDDNETKQIDNIIDTVIEYKLENRLLNDKYILDLLDKEVRNYIAKNIIKKSQSISTLDAFWTIIDDAIKCGRKRDIKSNLEIILPYITESKDKIEWFLELLSNKDYDGKIIEEIIEVCLLTIGEHKKNINQLNNKLEKVISQVTREIASSIGISIGELEKSIINIKDESQRDIIIKMMSRLREALKEVGIETAEEISNYNKIVELDEDKHFFKGNSLNTSGLIESLGVKVNDGIMYKSIMREIVEDEISE